MSRSKLGLIGLCVVVVGLMGVLAGPAQAAPEWLVLNTAKTGFETLPKTIEGQIDGASISIDTHLVKLHVRITCTGFTLVGTSLEPAGKLTNGGKIEFTGCKTFNAANGTLLPECGVKSAGHAYGTILSAAIKGQLQTNGLTKIEASTGSTLFTLEFEVGCVLPSPTTISGTLFVEDCEGKAATHLAKHLLKQGTGTSLFAGADTTEHLETSIIGSVWIFTIPQRDFAAAYP